MLVLLIFDLTRQPRQYVTPIKAFSSIGDMWVAWQGGRGAYAEGSALPGVVRDTCVSGAWPAPIPSRRPMHRPHLQVSATCARHKPTPNYSARTGSGRG